MAIRASKTLTDPRIAAQQAEREAQEAAWNAAIDAAVKTIHDADRKLEIARGLVETEEEAARGARAKVYVTLAKLSADNSMTADQIDKGLDAAIIHWYSGKKSKEGKLLIVDGKIPSVGTIGVLRSELKNAMHPNVRADLPAIIAPWEKAWNSNDEATANAIRKRFHAQHQMVTHAIRLAIGKPPKAKGDGTITEAAKKAAVAPVIAKTPTAVMAWVNANPPKGSGARQTFGGKTETPKSAPEKALWERDQLIAAVDAMITTYKQPDCLTKVVEALKACTAAKMLANMTSEAPKAPVPVAEPVPGAAELDDAVGSNDAVMMQQFQAFQQFQAMMAKANSGK